MTAGKASTSQITPRDYHRTLAVKIYPGEESREEKIGNLTYFVQSGEDWKKNNISSEKDANALSAAISADKKKDDSSFSSITIKKFDHFWYLGLPKNDHDLCFNGLRRHQSILTMNSCSLLTGNGKKIVISARQGTEGKQSAGDPEAGEFGIESEGTKRTFFLYRSVLFGADSCCDFKLGFRPFIAIVTMYRNRPHLVCIHNEEILVDGKKPEEAVIELKPETVFTIGGKTPFQVLLPAVQIDPLAAKTGPDALCLLDINSTGEVLDRIYLPLGKSLTIGRGAGCDIVIDQKTLSRKHSQIIVYEDHILVLDCYSKNGTFVNEEEIGRGRARAGDIVTFGDCNYLVSYYNG